MEYHQYKTEDFLTDPEFRHWVLSPNKQSNDFWDSIAKGHPHLTSSMALARNLILQMEFKVKEGDEDDYQEVLGRILQNKRSKYAVSMPEKMGNKSITKPIVRWLTAASIFIAIISYVFTAQKEAQPIQQVLSYVVKQNPKGQQSQIHLPDGTKVWLNAESSIRYRERFSDSVRLVELTGEAFFEVAENPLKPFTVISGNVTTTAKGTSFNIKAFQDEPAIEVSLVTGKVVVNTMDDQSTFSGDSYYLDPGQRITYDTGKRSLLLGEFSLANISDWKNGILSFNNASMEEVLKKLERWYGVSFVLQNHHGQQWNYKGEFERMSLESVLQRIGYVEHFKYTIENDTIYLTF